MNSDVQEEQGIANRKKRSKKAVKSVKVVLGKEAQGNQGEASGNCYVNLYIRD
jgi:hypothetical protein